MDKVYAKVDLSFGSHSYGIKIKGFEKVESFEEGLQICDANKKELQAFILDHEFATSTEEADPKYLVSALRFQAKEREYNILEFDLESYEKFVFVTKMPGGAYLVVE